MPDPDETRLHAYRKSTFRIREGARLRSVEEALSFVEERGFIFFWPVKGIDLPSLWTAVAGDRPVPNEHDDPGHITWRWKDSMLDQKRWYYGRLLRRKATMVNLEIIPYFYALSDRVGDLDDYMLLYEEGRLTFEERAIADALLNHGAQNTIELRRKAHLSATSAKSRFERAIAALQSGLYILPVGVAEVGAWRYAFVYELFDRWYPQVIFQARKISSEEAYRKLTALYLESVGLSTLKAIGQLFRWRKDTVHIALEELEREGLARSMDGEHWATSKLYG
ncbi:MAG: hypothetical protein A2Z14_09580 [Chloroflexi bacterium RBG_16_48_8]|nr:MAG: hypothetical protein A2Z14_09580 [Chloroflexi bacterium RBG_16_48_8]